MFGDLCGDDLVLFLIKNKTCGSSKTIIFYSVAVGLHAQPIKACQKFPHKRKAILFQFYTHAILLKWLFLAPETVFMSKLS
jgi:hypothetical protein